MYILKFKANKSKYFPDALAFSRELGGALNNGIVTIEIVNVLEAYAQIRSLFSFIQHWKGTTATFNGKPVHPYQFLLHAHWIGDCYDLRKIDNNCGNGWECIKIDNLLYSVSSPYFKTKTYWYQYGNWKGYKWMVDKDKIYKVLFDYADNKGITSCPFFDETKLRLNVQNLPSFLIPDNVTFEMVFREKWVDGQLLSVPDNIRHLNEYNKVVRLG
jgi:hypothetical protein